MVSRRAGGAAGRDGGNRRRAASFNDEFVFKVSDGLSKAGFRDIALEIPYR
jgi:hypothetical protein